MKLLSKWFAVSNKHSSLYTHSLLRLYLLTWPDLSARNRNFDITKPWSVNLWNDPGRAVLWKDLFLIERVKITRYAEGYYHILGVLRNRISVTLRNLDPNLDEGRRLIYIVCLPVCVADPSLHVPCPRSSSLTLCAVTPPAFEWVV